ncbi:MAG: ribosomal protein L7/L12 [Planctomycetes bacterium]|nr:ribosomal protein L7/L12 [Planctomycetota bacterium]
MVADLPAGREPVRVTGPLRDEDLARLRELLQRGEKIQAIKLHRERTGAGLKESKDAVEALESRWREEMTLIPGQRAGGCLSLLLLALVR